jgi:hypothetical protein
MPACEDAGLGLEGPQSIKTLACSEVGFRLILMGGDLCAIA